jgi:hypothetical protein
VTDQEVRSDVLVAFEYSYQHEEWVNPLEEALAGIGVKEALWKPIPDAKTIWEIVLHLAVWNENIVERIHTSAHTHPSEGAWPALPKVKDKRAWEAAQKRLWESLASVRSTIEHTSLDHIRSSPFGLGDLFCRFTHNAYHLGQITKMREFMEQETKAAAKPKKAG